MDATDLNCREWAVMEFGATDLGDRRRTRRLLRVAEKLAASPGGTLPEPLGAWAQLKAAYRLLGQEAVTYRNIIAPHWERTRSACQTPGGYLMVEDTTCLSYASHNAAEGLGWITGGEGKGIFLHMTLALRIEKWLPDGSPEVTVAGLLGQHPWVRTEPPKKPRETREERQRESEVWAAVFDEIAPLTRARWTYIADRESDIFRVLVKCAQRGVEYIVRAGQMRTLLEQEGSVFDAVASAEPLGRIAVELRARPGMPARIATVEMRSIRLTLEPPKAEHSRLKPLTLNVVEAREVEAPTGVEPIRWVLLTSWPAETFEAARRVVKAYSKRWLIEEYHKALKTGAGIEKSQLKTRQRLEALLGVLAVVAVRLLAMKLLCASRPDEAAPEGALGPEALLILKTVCGKSPGGWTNRTLLVSIAKMGGFLGRKGDGNPGWLTIWRGWQKLMLMAEGFRLGMGQTKCG